MNFLQVALHMVEKILMAHYHRRSLFHKERCLLSFVLGMWALLLCGFLMFKLQLCLFWMYAVAALEALCLDLQYLWLV